MSDRVLRLSGVRLRRGDREVLRDVSFETAPGELVVLMGHSGSGKTTVLRAVAGLERFEGGRIEVGDVTLDGGRALSAAQLRALRRNVGMVFQFHCLFEHLSVLDNVCLAPVHVRRVSRRDAEARARDLLAAFGVDHRAGALPRHLSGGEAQRVAIARALAVDPPLLLMDEPTASLDPARRNELGGLLTDLRKQGRTLVVATHDEEFTRTFSTRVLKMNGGVIES